MARFLDTAFSASITFLMFFIALSFSDKDIRLICAVSLTAAFCVIGIVSYLQKRRPFMFLKNRKRFSTSYVKAMLLEDPKSAHFKAFEALKSKYDLTRIRFSGGRLYFLHGPEKEPSILCVLQKLKASPDDILKIWKTHGKSCSVRAMVVCIPGKSDHEVMIQAYKLSEPKVVIVDKSQLRRLSARIATKETSEAKKKSFHPLRTLRAMVTGKRRHVYLLPGILFYIYHIFTGAIMYLVCSCVLLGIFTYSLFLKRCPESLI